MTTAERVVPGTDPTTDSGTVPGTGTRHVYVHVPFCAHRCGYCDFVTVTGRDAQHAGYVDAVLAELGRRFPGAGADTVFVGGGTPSLLADDLLRRLLAGMPRAGEVTVECNPETLTAAKAAALVESGVTRVSLGAQSFQPHLLEVLERRASPGAIRAAVVTLREAGVQSLNLDLMFGVPGQSADDLGRDLDAALALAPDHISYYELDAKPGTRFTHRHGPELERQADRMERHYERVVHRMTGAGYRWYETANFCLPGHQARHNLGYWLGRDYLGVGVGAVSTERGVRRRNAPRLRPYLDAVAGGREPPFESEPLAPADVVLERIMLGLRLDRPLELGAIRDGLDADGLRRMVSAGLVEEAPGTIQLSERGRFLANEVVSSIVR